jgi:rare lipoprotein A
VTIEEYIIGVLAFLGSCAAAQAQSWTGKASYYGGRGHMTCAHRSLPFGTHVRVTKLSNNRSAVLVVDDRGPFIKGRVIDTSVSAADVLGFRHAGLVQVVVETVTD